MNNRPEAVILESKRTAIGAFRGSLSNLSAPELGRRVAEQLIAMTHLNPDDIDQAIIGCVLQAGVGLNVARQIAVRAGIPVECPAFTVNEVCGSGLKAVELAAQAIWLGNHHLVLAGGVESMSRAPFLIDRTESTDLCSDRVPIDHIQHDGLLDPFMQEAMAHTSEVVASESSISRADQDAYAATSYARYFKARALLADEIVPVILASDDGDVLFDTDEPPRETTQDALARLEPLLSSSGTVTAGNASNLSDGAALSLIADRLWADRHNLPYKFVLRGFETVGLDPARMGLGPVKAIRALWQRFGISALDIDLYEINEAFAGQLLAVVQQLDLPPDRVNVNGGAIALGHPLGASGCRLVVTLTHERARRGSQRGIAALCIGGGMGIAALVETTHNTH